MSKVWIVVIVLVILGIAGYFYMNANKTMAPTSEDMIVEMDTTGSPSATMQQTIQLTEQNDSSESGTAMLSEKDGKVTVTLSMTGGPADVPQPAHIHVGSCPDVGAVSYPLTNVVNGTSVTVLETTLADLASKQPLGINVHKSVPEVKVYVACGDLNLPMSSATPATSPAAATGQSQMKY
jgi:hypothetical protein